MNTWIELFRGINMVGKRKLPMKELIPLLERLGARDVKTYHQSGNAVFRHRGKNATRLAGRISAAVGKAYGFEPLVMLLEGFHKTKLGGKLERALGVGKAGTDRTLGTLVKVIAIAEDMG